MAEIQIAKTGRARGTDGKDHEITADMLREVAESYDPKLHEAPLVLGHPKTDDPAHGWVSGLSFSEEDGVLLAVTRDVEPEFAEAVTTSRKFPKRSSSFYSPTSKANPTPGKWYLRHVGFLGASVPGMKGLAEVVSFKEGDAPEEAATYEFADGSWEDRELARVLRSLRDWIVAKWGLEEADKALPSWRVDTIQEVAAAGGSMAFAEALAILAPPKDESAGAAEDEATAAPAAEVSPELAARFAELEARERALAEKEAALAAQAKTDAAKAKAAEHLAFCESIVASGRVLPLPAPAVVGLMARLEGLEEPDVLSFGEGRETAEPVMVFRELLERLPVSVDFAERSRGEGGGENEDPSVRANRIRAIQDEAAARGEHLTTVQAARRLET